MEFLTGTDDHSLASCPKGIINLVLLVAVKVGWGVRVDGRGDGRLGQVGALDAAPGPGPGQLWSGRHGTACGCLVVNGGVGVVLGIHGYVIPERGE